MNIITVTANDSWHWLDILYDWAQDLPDTTLTWMDNSNLDIKMSGESYVGTVHEKVSQINKLAGFRALQTRRL
jgi:hypothetical protein